MCTPTIGETVDAWLVELRAQEVVIEPGDIDVTGAHVREIIRIMEQTGDHLPLELMAGLLGYALVPRAAVIGSAQAGGARRPAGRA